MKVKMQNTNEFCGTIYDGGRKYIRTYVYSTCANMK